MSGVKASFLSSGGANMNNHNYGVHVYYCRNAAHGGEMPPAISRLEIRSDVHLEAVPCSGKVDARYLLKAFESGASAVAVIGCASGHCKLMEGNLRATKRVTAVRQILAEAGLDPNNIQVFLPGGPEQGALEAVADNVAQFISSQRHAAYEVTVQ